MGLLGNMWKAAKRQVKRVVSGKRSVKPAATTKREPKKKLPKMKRRYV